LIKYVELLLLLSLTSCYYPKVTGRQNFDGILHGLIGSDLRQFEGYPFKLGYKGNLVRSQPLSNGNVENYYRLPYKVGKPPEQCTYVLEITPATQRVTAVRIDTGEKACIIPQ
jgi:hypothetical protein